MRLEGDRRGQSRLGMVFLPHDIVAGPFQQYSDELRVALPVVDDQDAFFLRIHFRWPGHPPPARPRGQAQQRIEPRRTFVPAVY